jgi:TATA-binding protein-associated factor
MTSRLDRLFILLESGSSPITRKAAAKQIGEVQKLHPHELHNLLNRLITFLHSTNWDTRIAASQAVQAILENVPQWQPLPAVGGEQQSSGVANPCNSDATRLSFDKFDLDNVLRKGAHLMGSEGKEFDLVDEGEPCDERERLAKQRELLNEKLGLNQAKCLGELTFLL